MNQNLSTLLARSDIWRASTSPPQTHGLATGYPALDRSLHQGGWPTGAITELLCDDTGSGELQLLLPALTQYAQQGRKLIFVSPPYLPYAPALQRAGIPLTQVVMVRARSTPEQLWAAGQLLRADIAGAVLCWLADEAVKHVQLRKLQLAAQTGPGLAVLFRSSRVATDASPAALRIALSATRHSCRLHIIKQRGGWAGQIVNIDRPEGLVQGNIPVADLPVHQAIRPTPGRQQTCSAPCPAKAHLSAESYRSMKGDSMKGNNGDKQPVSFANKPGSNTCTLH